MNKFLSLFDLAYLFDPTPKISLFGQFFLVGIFVFTIIGGIVFRYYLKKHREDRALRKLMKNLPKKLIAIGISGLFFIFVRWQQMPFISMTFIGILLLLMLCYIVIKSMYQIKKTYPEQLKYHLKRAEAVKYLPARKK